MPEGEERRQLLDVRLFHQVTYITQNEVELMIIIFLSGRKKRPTKHVLFSSREMSFALFSCTS